MPRFSPPTPRSRRLGRELRKLREGRSTSLEEAGRLIDCSPSRVSRIESGDIKPRVGDVMEILAAYEIPLEREDSKMLLALTRDLREAGWWQRVDALSSKYATFIAYEREADELQNYEQMLVPGLFQTEEYAREVISVGRETDANAIQQLVEVRMKRQEVLKRDPKPLVIHTILSEAALTVEVGSPEVVNRQLKHIVELSRHPNITTQVLRFAAGAHMSTGAGFATLRFGGGDPPLGYIETLAGELFLENPKDINRLSTAYDQLKTLAMSPAESVRFIKERANAI